MPGGPPMSAPDPTEHECSDEPRLTAEEWQYVAAVSPPPTEEEDED